MNVKEKLKGFWEAHKKEIFVGTSVGVVAGAFFAGATLDHKLIEKSWDELFLFKPELKDAINDARIQYITKTISEE